MKKVIVISLAILMVLTSVSFAETEPENEFILGVKSFIL